MFKSISNFIKLRIRPKLKQTCSVIFCFKKSKKFLRLSAGEKEEFLPFCEGHANVTDEMMKNGEIKLNKQVQYSPLKREEEKCSGKKV